MLQIILDFYDNNDKKMIILIIIMMVKEKMFIRFIIVCLDARNVILKSCFPTTTLNYILTGNSFKKEKICSAQISLYIMAEFCYLILLY